LERIIIVALLAVSCAAAEAPKKMELTRAARPWEFVSAVGQRAGVLGNEGGKLEAWVYPLKLFRDFHLLFHLQERVIPAESLARSVRVRPEASTIIYAGDTFQVQETLFVPMAEPGAAIILEVETQEPLEIEAVFHRDFQLEWPAAFGGSYMNWDPKLRAFSLGEERKQYAGLVGSPTAEMVKEEYFTNYSASGESSFLLGAMEKGRSTKLIAIAGSVHGMQEAEATYRKITNVYQDLSQGAAKYYADYLDRTVKLELPDAQLQQAYDWARVSMLQGLVESPYLGKGLIAGYRTSGDWERPGFAWFFGRDSLWTDLALDAAGDFETTKTALDFIGKYQRTDGKIPHEIAQSASLVPWFSEYPYAYASADATPLYIIAMNDYATNSGDVEFIRAKWECIWKAYQFLQSTYDAQHLPKNLNIGHGWVEGGPLLPVETEFYQSGLGVEALRALAHLAELTARNDAQRELTAEFAKQQQVLNQTFWSANKKMYAFALDGSSNRVDTPSVLATVPMWFGLTDADKTQLMLDQLAQPDHHADWGMRIISSSDPRYNPGGYHFGSVWPLFTGWASVGEYRYHRTLPAYENLRANALLGFDGSLGHFTEVLSGDYYQPLSTNSPHQIWSAAMVVNPILRGMMGIEVDAIANQLKFTPHVPSEWASFGIHNVRVGKEILSLSYTHTLNSITLDIDSNGSCEVEFSPALSLRTSLVSASVDGKTIRVRPDPNAIDQHAPMTIAVHKGHTRVALRLKDDFGFSVSSQLPELGTASHGLRVVSEFWTSSRDSLHLSVAGVSGHHYDLTVWNPAQIARVEGAELLKQEGTTGSLVISFPAGQVEGYTRQDVVLHMVGRR
jgi:GH15 family glucan-1,4-alpha-glucosidase